MQLSYFNVGIEKYIDEICERQLFCISFIDRGGEESGQNTFLYWNTFERGSKSQISFVFLAGKRSTIEFHLSSAPVLFLLNPK